MSDVTSLGTILINDALPPEMRKKQWALDKKSVHSIFMELAKKHPEKYKEVLNQLSDIGRTAVWTEGASVSLASLLPSKKKQEIMGGVREKVQGIIDNDDLTPDQRKKAIVETLLPVYSELSDAIYEESRAEGSPFIPQIESGARGKKGDLSSLRGADLLAMDQRGDFIPVPLLNSYAEGYTPAQYFAASYGQRKGALDVKMATADAGFFCLDGSTLVRMADFSEKPICDIREGELVMGADIEGNVFPVIVSRVFNNGVREVEEFVFRRGRNREDYVTVTATPEHKVLAVRQLGKAKAAVKSPTKLRLGSCGTGLSLIPSGMFTSYGLPQKREPLAFVYGYLLGDGGLTGHDTTFSTNDKLVVERLQRDVAPTHGIKKVKRSSPSYEYVIRPVARVTYARDARGRVIKGEVDPLRIRLRELGILGKYSYEKAIADEALHWDRESVTELLAGIFESDGCVSSTNHGKIPIISLGVTSPELCYGVKRLLELRLGIYGSECHKREHAVGTSRTRVDATGKTRVVTSRRPYYQFVIANRESVERFAAFIRMPGKKGEKLALLLKEAPPAKVDSRYTYAYSSKRQIGLRTTYDLEVAHSDHLFVLANGMVVSNSKQLVNAAHRQVITKDVPDPTRLPVGLPTPIDDGDNIGAVLAHKAGKYEPGTILTSEIIEDLKDEDVDEVLIHSPMTEVTSDGGLSRYAAGRRGSSGLPLVGENVGVAAAQAIGERLSQGSLSSKHSSGVGTRINRAGFEYINRLTQAPEHFPESGPLSEEDGTVDNIREAPQGGKYVTVSKKDYYVPDGVNVTVKIGEQVEQGDDLSDGVPHPGQLVRLRGIGEARRVFLKYFKEGLDNSGVPTHRRNAESVVAGLINWARVTNPDGYGESVYDDIVPFNSLASSYKPRQGAQERALGSAVGQYLEEPALHYTPGTRITKKVAKELGKWGVNKAFTHTDAPDFQPEGVRGIQSVYHDPDWQTRLIGFYTASAFEKSLHRGLESDTNSTSFVPSLANPSQFGKNLQGLGKYGDSR
jgi:hypothetical protein